MKYDSFFSLFNQFIEEQEYQARRAPETIKGYRRAFHLLTKYKPDIQIADLGSIIMSQFFKYLDDRNGGIKISTVATYRSKLNTFFEWLVRKKHLQENPFAGIPYPTVTYTDRRYLVKEELDKIISAIELIKWQSSLTKKRNRLLFYICLYTGIRRNELIQIKIPDIINRNNKRRDLYLRGETSKSKKDRYIPINKQLEILLDDYLQERKKNKYTTPFLLVQSKQDSGMTLGSLKNVEKLIKRDSRVNFHMHRLRHTFAINFYNETHDLYALHRLLGHKSLKMTLTYLRNAPDDPLRELIDKIDIDKMY